MKEKKVEGLSKAEKEKLRKAVKAIEDRIRKKVKIRRRRLYEKGFEGNSPWRGHKEDNY